MCDILITERKKMTEEPTALMTVLDILIKIVVYVSVMGGFIFFLCLLNCLLDKMSKEGKKFVMFPFF